MIILDMSDLFSGRCKKMCTVSGKNETKMVQEILKPLAYLEVARCISKLDSYEVASPTTTRMGSHRVCSDCSGDITSENITSLWKITMCLS